MYQSLQAGRAIAAILVLLFHLGHALAAEKYFGVKPLAVPFSFGDAGVEFFFVLSGFIILTAHRKDLGQPRRLGSYLRKRLVRVYPTYWIIFLAVFLLALASAATRSSLPRDPVSLIKAILLIPQGGDLAATGAPVLIVAWTLQYEIFFYLVFSLLILHRGLALVAGAILLLVVLALDPSKSQGVLLNFIVNDYVLLFAMGMGVAALHGSKRLAARSPLPLLALGAVGFACVAADKVLQTHELIALRVPLYGLASSALILGLVLAEDRGLKLGRQKWLQLLGDASYALYLLHFPMISVLCKVAIALKLKSMGVAGALLAGTGIVVACLAAAVLFHLWVERPLIALLRERKRDAGPPRPPTPQPAPAPAAGDAP